MIIPNLPPERKLTKAEKKAIKRVADAVGRKLVEEEYLWHFIDAYNYSLEEKLGLDLSSSRLLKKSLVHEAVPLKCFLQANPSFASKHRD